MIRSSLIVAFLLGGCSDVEFHPIKEGGDGDGPAIEVDPDFLDFGTASKDDDAVVKSFLIRSVGATDLEVSSIELSGSSAASYAIISESSSFVLPPGAEQSIDVAFLPMGANDQIGTAVVSSDDPDKPQLPVELLGQGAVPELEITPDPIDFAETYIGCPQDNNATLTNVGTDTLIISTIDFTGDPELTLTEDFSPPITLEPGEEHMLSFTFTPLDATDYTGELAVVSNEPLNVRTAAALGEGAYAGAYTDTWEIPTDPPSDILFAVDQSGSMDDDQTRLANNFTTFITQLSGYSNDWQITVANDDNGCNRSGILTPSVSDYEGKFRTAVSGGGGAYTESLLTVGANAIENTDSGDCNTGFIRADAMLHLILVSDEPEQSNWTSGSSWSDLVSAIIAKKGSSGMVKISAIAGPVPGGCSSADAGTGYSEAVAATGGVFLSICSDWANPTNLAMLAEASINQDTFLLSHDAVEETIAVQVNGATRTTWYYEAIDNSVVFTEKIPEEGDVVEISYSGLPTCD